MRRLEELLYRVDHKGYGAYKELYGSYEFPFYILSIDHVQSDPFAPPSSLSVRIQASKHGFPREFYDVPHRRIMLQDFLLRKFYDELTRMSHRARGSGKSGLLSVSACQQEVLERSAVTFDPTNGLLTVRFYAGFPAAGRTTLAMELKRMLFDHVPLCIKNSVVSEALSPVELRRWISLADDQKAIRDSLPSLNLIAFVANGSVLPRKSGVDDKPMVGAVAFESTAEDLVTLPLPGGRSVSGLGVKKGITLIVGGGYHGKSTLLEAIERGVYNHIPGDGREYVITEDTAMTIRSEDGRSVKQLDISPFIRNLPNGKDTVCFFTEDASGSTSQAASTIEAVLSGSRTLLIDEDTSATNFMVRDNLMQRVINPEHEPIIPFISRMRQLYDSLGVSTILVAGSSGAFFHVSDTILQMKDYRPINVTNLAKEAASRECYTPDVVDPLIPFFDKRIPQRNREFVDSGRVKVRGTGTDSVSLNHESVELRFLEQIVDVEQTNLLGQILRTLETKYFNGRDFLTKCVEDLFHNLLGRSFSAVCDSAIPGNLAMIRRQELWAMINRYRGLQLLVEGSSMQSIPSKRSRYYRRPSG